MLAIRGLKASQGAERGYVLAAGGIALLPSLLGPVGNATDFVFLLVMISLSAIRSALGPAPCVPSHAVVSTVKLPLRSWHLGRVNHFGSQGTWHVNRDGCRVIGYRALLHSPSEHTLNLPAPYRAIAHFRVHYSTAILDHGWQQLAITDQVNL